MRTITTHSGDYIWWCEYCGRVAVDISGEKLLDYYTWFETFEQQAKDLLKRK